MSVGPLAGFESGAVLSWALPLATLLGVCLWWLASFKRGAK
jgi:hypothetical protein